MNDGASRPTTIVGRHRKTAVAQTRHTTNRPSYLTSTPQREFWNDQPVQLETVWTLTKRGHVAQCVLFSHQFGWELRLEVGELFRTQVCRSDRDSEDVSGEWKAAMIEKGWTE